MADQIPDYSESNNECSQSGLLEWTNYSGDACYGYESVGPTQPLGTLDESVHERTSGAGYSNTFDYINPSLLTKHAHEPQNRSLSGLDHSTTETIANNSQPQLSLKSVPYGVQQPSPAPTSSIQAPSKANDTSMEAYPSPSLLLSLGQFTPQPASPPDIAQVGSDAPHGKMAIESAPTSFVCKTCTKSFPTMLRYHQHVNRRSCQAPSECKQCGQSIKHAKDLKRHLGSSKASPSCPALKNVSLQAKGFACICSSKTYTRKDSLIRHLRTSRTENHCCRACGKSPCTCS